MTKQRQSFNSPTSKKPHNLKTLAYSLLLVWFRYSDSYWNQSPSISIFPFINESKFYTEKNTKKNRNRNLTNRFVRKQCRMSPNSNKINFNWIWITSLNLFFSRRKYFIESKTINDRSKFIHSLLIVFDLDPNIWQADSCTITIWPKRNDW